MPPLLEIGTVNFEPDVDPSALPPHLAAWLNNVHAKEVEVRGNRVTFKRVRMGSYRSGVSFGFGDLTVNPENREVRYCLSYKRLVISSVVTFGIAVIFLFVSPGFAGFRSSKWIIFFPILWVFFTCANFATGISQFDDSLERCVASAPRRLKRSGLGIDADTEIASTQG
jgi:hypothetical protein